MGKRGKSFERQKAWALLWNRHSAKTFFTNLISHSPDKIGNVNPIHTNELQAVCHLPKVIQNDRSRIQSQVCKAFILNHYPMLCYTLNTTKIIKT